MKKRKPINIGSVVSIKLLKAKRTDVYSIRKDQTLSFIDLHHALQQMCIVLSSTNEFTRVLTSTDLLIVPTSAINCDNAYFV